VVADVDHRLDLGRAGGAVKLVIGEVVCVVAEPELVRDEMWVDASGLEAIGRLGGREYLVTIPGATYSEPRIALR
jgi:hypothetical protein